MQNNVSYDTYNIYDEWGNLMAVLPPQASDEMKSSGASWNSVSSATLRSYAYLYKYDEFYRVTAKRFPGQNWMYHVYDKSDRLILTQNGEQRKRGEWSFSIPDGLGRICLSGICYNTFSSSTPSLSIAVRATRDNSVGLYKGYILTGITLTNPQVLSVNYYDDYHFMGKNDIPVSTHVDYKYEFISGYGEYSGKSAKDLLTGTLTAKLDDSSTLSYLVSVKYYDYRARLVQVKSSNHKGGVEKEYIGYDFIGHPLKRKHIHIATDKPTYTEQYEYAYDPAGRLLTTRHSINGGTAVLLANNEYDGLGRLKSSKRNGQVNLQTTYTYNVRSWLKTLSSPLFQQSLYYNDKRTNGTNISCFSGDISGMDWKILSNGDNVSRGYDFTYDGLSRLTKANYLENNALSSKFNTSYNYDKQGNITSLQRYGQTGANAYGLIDNLSMVLMGNQLKSVNDAATVSAYNAGFEFKDGAKLSVEYVYDTNGNLIKDLNKGISSIQYNVLNLPSSITFSDGSTITYTYSMDGSKLRTIHKIGNTITTTDYCGNVIYENNIAKLLLTEGGYISLNDNQYHYYLEDYQGNNRVVASSAGSVEETNHYYPFGGLLSGTNTIQPYKYNGKEFDSKKGLNIYDYGARHYDATIVRWHVIDPLCEKSNDISPYTYCNNSPIKHIDPDGKYVWALIGATVDYGFQVYDNYKLGKNGYNAWIGDVNFVKVGLSAINPTGKFKLLKTLAVEGLKEGVFVTPNNGVGIEVDAGKIVTNSIVNTVVNVGVGKLIESSSDEAPKSVNKEMRNANQNIKTAERRIERSPLSETKQTQLDNAKSNV